MSHMRPPDEPLLLQVFLSAHLGVALAQHFIIFPHRISKRKLEIAQMMPMHVGVFLIDLFGTGGPTEGEKTKNHSSVTYWMIDT